MLNLDKLFSFFAPHDCLICGNEGSILCKKCMNTVEIKRPVCYECKAVHCFSACSRKSPINRLYYIGLYEDFYKKILLQLKYSSVQEAAVVMALLMARQVDILPCPLITYSPTTASRTRTRGYDQSKLLAKNIARINKQKFIKFLIRTSKTRQVGSSRINRLNQAKNSFRPINVGKLPGAHVLLVDDVLTTGATVEAAASTLKAFGAAQVDVLVFAIAKNKSGEKLPELV